MKYILLGADKLKVYVKQCKSSKSELLIEKETDFIRQHNSCSECFYYGICCLVSKSNVYKNNT